MTPASEAKTASAGVALGLVAEIRDDDVDARAVERAVEVELGEKGRGAPGNPSHFAFDEDRDDRLARLRARRGAVHEAADPASSSRTSRSTCSSEAGGAGGR